MSDGVGEKMDNVLCCLAKIVSGRNFGERDGMRKKGKCIAVDLRSRIGKVTLDASIMLRRRADRPSVSAVVRPGGAVGGFGVNNDVGTRGRQGASIEIEVAEDVCEGGEFWIGARITEKVESEDCLGDEAIPFAEGKIRVAGGKTREEMIFEGLDGPFGRIAPVDMGRDELKAYILFPQGVAKFV